MPKPETFINRLRGEIALYEIHKKDAHTLEFCTAYRDKFRVLETAKTLGASACVKKERGLPVLAARYKKRFGIFAGGIIGLFLIYYSTFFIWEIRVEGNTYVPSSDICCTLQSLGIAEGKKKETATLEKIYNSFLLAEKRISWIAVNYDGTVAHVEVKETEQIPEKLDRSKNINIVAACDGVVKRIEALDGERAVEPGETVTKGQLLISSFIETRKTGVLMRAARGSVWATTVRNYDVYIPKTHQVKHYTGSIKQRRFLKILGNKLPLTVSFHPAFGHYESRSEEKMCVLAGKIHLPLAVVTDSEVEYRSQSEEIAEEQAAYLAAAELNARIEKELFHAEIISRSENKTVTDDSYVFHYELICLENIAVETEFYFDNGM